MAKRKRYYKNGERVWSLTHSAEVEFLVLNKQTMDATILVNGQPEFVKIWEIDKLNNQANKNNAVRGRTPAKGEPVEKLEEKRNDVPKPNRAAIRAANNPKRKKQQVTYFASFGIGGIIPSKSPENAGYDCYARLPHDENGDVYFPMKKGSLYKIPLGFASYLQQNEALSLKHERSSIGAAGLINLSGLIDSTYQGEIILQVVPLTHDVVITSHVSEPTFYEGAQCWYLPYSKAITQAVIIKLSHAKVEEIEYEELKNKPSERGTGGWGSSGK